ncbi:hypothetical protein BGZ65_006671 [Modicella reniformis]|uniref:Uncharacterized protein n=1 Tax=Modicella reniformis TaxID=1440133 RepID=A0A9P6LXT3_9FUNG|nr:hypothetical protein BGZ65_006671 [Modicella reniformis]
MSCRNSMRNNFSDLFDKNEPRTDGGGLSGSSGSTTNTLAPNVPELVIKTYKPNVAGKPRRRGTSNIATSGSTNSSTSASRNKATSSYGQSKSTDGYLRPSPTSTPIVATNDTNVQDDGLLLDTASEVEHLNAEAVMFNSSRMYGNNSNINNFSNSSYSNMSTLRPTMTRSMSGPSSITTTTNTSAGGAVQARNIRSESQRTSQGSPSYMAGVLSTPPPPPTAGHQSCQRRNRELLDRRTLLLDIPFPQVSLLVDKRLG